MTAKKWHRVICCFALWALILSACGTKTPSIEPTREPEMPPTEEPTPTPEPLPGRLAVHEVMPIAPEGGSPWVELINAGETSVSSAGVVLTDMDDNSYTIPDESPSIQPGDLVLIQFDGQDAAADDYDASDGLVVLHTPEALTDPFDPAGDQVALFSSAIFVPDNAIDFVAWALPPVENDNPAVAAGIWPDGAYINAERGGEITGASQLGESIGIFPGQPAGTPASWVVYAASETTPGEMNGVPTPGVLMPGPGAIVLRDGFLLAWYAVPHAANYVLQIDDSAEFDSPEIDLTLQETLYEPEDPPAEGTYYWRLKAQDALGGSGPFTAASEITVVDIAPPELNDQAAASQDLVACVTTGTSWLQMAAATLIGFGSMSSSEFCQVEIEAVDRLTGPFRQHAGDWNGRIISGLGTLLQGKDSDMICWDGDDETGIRKPWDGAHMDTPGNISPHGRQYCARASIAMINHYYNGDLSQDRITYQHFGRWSPYFDLGHDKPLKISDGANLLGWAVQTRVSLTYGKPTFAQIQGWVNEGRAVMAGIPGHAIVLRGWATFQGEHPRVPVGTPFVAYNDPWVDRVIWRDYASLRLTNTRVPTGTPAGRKLEPTLKQDPDDDGINSFDEIMRFHTDPNNTDTDFDCVADKADMVGFLYHPVNVYNWTWADFDSDGSDKYLDPDNDNGGVIDGNEDVNWNGHVDPLETTDFNKDDDDPEGRACIKPFVVFVDGLYGGVRHETGYSFVLTKVYIYGNDPEPIANATVTMRMDSQGGSSEQVQIATGEDGAAEGEFKIFSYGTYTLTVDQVEGENMVYAPSMNEITSITVRVGPSEMPLPTTREETIQSFAAKLSDAFRTSNWNFALGRVHPAVIDLYGAPSCAAYLNDQSDSTFNIAVVTFSGPDSWDWERDERVTRLESVFEVQAQITSFDQTKASVLHFVLMEDGTFRWLTDCGVPLP